MTVRVVVLLALAGCSRAAGGSSTLAPALEVVRRPVPGWCTQQDVEDASPTPMRDPRDVGVATFAGAQITRVTVRTPHGHKLARETVQAQAGTALDPATVREDVRRLYDLELYRDVRVLFIPARGGRHTRGELVYELEPHPRIAHVFATGADATTLRTLQALEGTLYEPERLHRLGWGIVAVWQQQGYAQAEVSVVAQVAPEPQVCFAFRPGPRYHIAELRFVGNRRAKQSELLRALRYDNAANQKGNVFDREALAMGLTFVTAWYYDRGFVNVRVEEPEVTIDDKTGAVRVRIALDEGPKFRVGRVSLRGAPPAREPALRRLITTKPGEVFSRRKVAADLERLTTAARETVAGQAGADLVWVDVASDIHPERRVIDLVLEIHLARPDPKDAT